MTINLVVLLITVLFSAFFSGMEIAFMASNRLRIEVDKKQGKFQSGIISRFFKQPATFITAMLIGNNLALVFYGQRFETILSPWFESITASTGLILLLNTTASTIVILFLAEFMPKALFQNIPNKALNFFAIPLSAIYAILFYPSKLVIFISNLLMRIIGIKLNKSAESLTFGKIDLDNLIKNTPAEKLENVDIQNMKMFQNALQFSSIKVRECTQPRTEIVALEIDDSIETLKHTFSESGYSKILIYEENIDNIIGYVHTSTIFSNPHKIRDILMPISFVPESMPANTLLTRLIKDGKTVSVVVDEFGGTAGIVTIEDILEEIFGEFEDEHDLPDLTEKKISDSEYEFSARFEIDYLNEKYNLGIPETDEYETLAGFILHHHQNIPLVNSKVCIGKFSFKILEATPNRIEYLKLNIDFDKKEE